MKHCNRVAKKAPYLEKAFASEAPYTGISKGCGLRLRPSTEPGINLNNLVPDRKRKMNCELTQEILKSKVFYDPSTGHMKRTDAFHRSHIGRINGSANKKGYLQMGILGKQYLIHRLAWLYVYGQWPKELIDHIDNNKTNNKIENLREATCSQNLQNQTGPRSNGSSGYLGVSFNKRMGKWRAKIVVDKKYIHIGYYGTAEVAHHAYMMAKLEYHPYGEIAKQSRSYT